MAGFSIDAIRNANRITILFQNYEKDDKGNYKYVESSPSETKDTFKDDDRHFTAYLKDGFGFTLKNKYSRWGGQQAAFAGDSILNKFIGTLIQQTSGVETVIDFNNNIRFTGSDPLDFNINCFLYANEDWDTSILKPIETLCKAVVPQRIEQYIIDVNKNETDLSQVGVTLPAKKGEEKGKTITIGDICDSLGITRPSADSTIWQAAAKGISAALGMLLPAYLLQTPDAYGEGKHVDVLIGNFLVRDVIIDSVNFQLPKFFMSGGYPNYVDLNIAFQTKRSVYFGTDGKATNIPLLGFNKVTIHNEKAQQ